MRNEYKIVRLLIPCLMAWTLAIGVWPSTTCQAQDTDPQIRAIIPMEEVGTYQVDINAQTYFDQVGILNLIESSHIIIGDSTLKVASGVNLSGMVKWTTVGAILNEAGEVVALETVFNEPN